MSVEGQSGNERRPSLEELIIDAHQRFNANRFNQQGRDYDTLCASEDVIAEVINRGVDISSLVFELTMQTALMPKDVKHAVCENAPENWEEFYQLIAEQIIIEELYKIPGTMEEEDRREREYLDRHSPEI